MTWWFHLLVRRVESLRKRCDVAERVVRAAGRLVYLDRSVRLLVKRTIENPSYISPVLAETVNGLQHTFLNVASYVSGGGSVSGWSFALRKHVAQSVWRYTGISGEYVEEYQVDGKTYEVVCWREGKMPRVVYSKFPPSSASGRGAAG